MTSPSVAPVWAAALAPEGAVESGVFAPAGEAGGGETWDVAAGVPSWADAAPAAMAAASEAVANRNERLARLVII
jgi:hypothetical protein